MCMFYKGVAYHYAFEFKISIDYDAPDRIFNVVITNYREETQDFAGLCLENEHKVVSREKVPFAAFFDIVNQIANAIIADEKAYMEAHPGQFPSPFMSVQAPVFLEQFEKCRKSKKSLDWYDKLKGYFEKPETMPEKVFHKTSETALYDCQNVSLFSYLVRSQRSPIENVSFFRI